MNINIQNSGREPIYEQIFSQIKEQIISGDIKEGELLPSIRNLAKNLRISVITTKRAYDELERAGYIYTVVGKGSFAAKGNPELIKEEILRKIEEHMREILLLGKSVSLTRNDIYKMLEAMEESE